jgi:hypothetical protein
MLSTLSKLCNTARNGRAYETVLGATNKYICYSDGYGLVFTDNLEYVVPDGKDVVAVNSNTQYPDFESVIPSGDVCEVLSDSQIRRFEHFLKYVGRCKTDTRLPFSIERLSFLDGYLNLTQLQRYLKAFPRYTIISILRYPGQLLMYCTYQGKSFGILMNDCEVRYDCD